MLARIRNAYQRYVEWNFKRLHPPVTDDEKAVLMMLAAQTEDVGLQAVYQGLLKEYSRIDGSQQTYQSFLEKFTQMGERHQTIYQNLLDDLVAKDRDERETWIIFWRNGLGLPGKGIDERALLIVFFILMGLVIITSIAKWLGG